MNTSTLNRALLSGPKFYRAIAIASLVAICLAASSAFAANATWSSTAGTGNMATGTNWFEGVAPGTTTNATTTNSTDIAIFNSVSTNQTISISTTRNIGGLYFDTASAASYTFSSNNSLGVRFYLTRGLSTQMTSNVTNSQNLTAAYLRLSSGISGSNNYSFINDSLTSSAILTLGTIANYAGTTTTLILRGSNTGNNEVTGAISENASYALSVSKQDAGTWILGTANTYTGGTTLSAGLLGIGSSTALGTGTLTINGGAISSNSSARTLNNAVVVGGNFSFGGLGQSITLNGTVDLGGVTRIMTLAQNSATLANVVSNGGITLESSSSTRSLILSGNNTYQGGTSVNGGILKAGSSTALGSTSGSLTLGANGTLDMNGNNLTVGSLTGASGGSITNTLNATTSSLTLNNTDNSTYAASLADGTGVVALVKNGAGSLRLSGNLYSGGTTLNSGTIELASSSALGTGNVTINGGALTSVTSQRTLTNNILVGGNFTLGKTSGGQSTTLNGAMDLGGSVRTITLENSATVGGIISNGGLVLASSGGSKTLTLNADNIYSGATTVSSGVLAVNGNLTNSAVTVQNGGTLSRGASANAMSVASLTLNTGSTLALTINSTTSFGGLNSPGPITLNGNGALTLAFGAALTSGDSIDLFTGSVNGNFATVAATGSFSGSFTNTSGSLWTFANDTNLTFDNATGLLSYAAVPEPSAFALLLFGIGACWALRKGARRRQF